MIKRIVFDLDNTLIPWKNEYVEGFKRAVIEYQIPFDISKEGELNASYEKKYSRWTIENMKEHFKKEYNIEVSTSFIEAWIEYLGEMSEENSEIIETLEYLSKRYELVVLTNFFKKCQEKRLETARMRKYFIEVIGGDAFTKPDPRSFALAIGPHLPEECIMIGDNLEIDIKGALACGMKAIYLSKKEGEYDFPRIKKLKECKRILTKEGIK